MRPPTRQKPPPMSVLLEHSRYRQAGAGMDLLELEQPSEDSEAEFV